MKKMNVNARIRELIKEKKIPEPKAMSKAEWLKAKLSPLEKYIAAKKAG